MQRSLVDTIEQTIGGTPDRFPERYEKRSPDAEKIAQWDKPFLIMQGGAIVGDVAAEGLTLKELFELCLQPAPVTASA